MCQTKQVQESDYRVLKKRTKEMKTPLMVFSGSSPNVHACFYTFKQEFKKKIQCVKVACM